MQEPREERGRTERGKEPRGEKQRPRGRSRDREAKEDRGSVSATGVRFSSLGHRGSVSVLGYFRSKELGPKRLRLLEKGFGS